MVNEKAIKHYILHKGEENKSLSTEDKNKIENILKTRDRIVVYLKTRDKSMIFASIYYSADAADLYSDPKSKSIATKSYSYWEK